MDVGFILCGRIILGADRIKWRIRIAEPMGSSDSEPHSCLTTEIGKHRRSRLQKQWFFADARQKREMCSYHLSLTQRGRETVRAGRGQLAPSRHDKKLKLEKREETQHTISGIDRGFRKETGLQKRDNLVSGWMGPRSISMHRPNDRCMDTDK
jgi:hypothetical protein